MLVTDYGFHVTAVRNISINRENRELVDRIFSTVLCTKFFLLILCLSILTPLCVFVPKFRIDALVYLLSFGFVFGSVLFPIWFFQGIERMIFITIADFIGKLIFTISIFFLIKEVSDYLWVPLLYSAGQIISAIVALIIIFKHHRIKLIWPRFEDITGELRTGFRIFYSWAAISLYTVSNVFFLGLFTNDNAVVAYYGVGEKLIKAFQRLFGPVVQATYPYLSGAYSNSQKQAINSFKKLIKIITPLTLLLFFIIQAFAGLIVKLIFGSGFSEVTYVVRILSINIVFATMASVLGRCFLLASGYHKIWSRTVLTASILHMLWLFIFVILLDMKHIGASTCSVITEFIVFSVMLYFFRSITGKIA